MGEDPGRIRQEIAETRERMSESDAPERMREELDSGRVEVGERVEALGYKADVKSRVKDSIAEKKDAVVGSLSGTKDAVVDKVTGAVPDAEGMKRGARRGVGIAKENPLGLAIGGAAAGFLLGLLVPSTQVEDERLGDLADDVKDRARQTGQEAMQRGKQVAQEAVESARETVRESGQQQTQEMAATLKETAQEVASSQRSE